MGSISKRKTDGKYLAQVLISGKRKSKVFIRLADAKQWVYKQELQKNISINLSNKGLNDIINLIEVYIAESSFTRSNGVILRGVVKADVFQTNLRSITTEHINEWIQGSLTGRYTGKPNKPSSVQRNLNALAGFFTWAKKRNLIATNPVTGHDKIEKVEHRERTASPDEILSLADACGYIEGSPPETQMQLAFLAFLFSCTTGMRAGEILKIERTWRDDRLLHIPKEATKTGTSRTIMLNNKALEIFSLVESLGFHPNIWGITDANRDALWRKLRDKAGLRPVVDSKGNVIKEGLNFHDGRATFCTWAASPGKDGAPRLDVMSLARQTGHKDLKMLMRYYRPDMNDLVKRLND